MPRSTLATTIQDHAGAQIMRNGTGTPKSHPNMSTGLRPHRSAICPETKSTNAFVTPKLTIKAVMAEGAWIETGIPDGNVCFAIGSRPTRGAWTDTALYGACGRAGFVAP